MIILVQSGFVPDKLTIRAKSDGLRAARVKVRTEPVPANVGMPANLPVKQPHATDNDCCVISLTEVNVNGS